MNTYDNLTGATNALRERGYTDQFRFVDGQVHKVDTDRFYDQDELYITEFHRFAGADNPSLSTVIFALEAEDNTRGILVISYGANANMKLISFMDKVRIKPSHHQDSVYG